MQWADLASKAEARLEALFSTVAVDNNFDFDTFNAVSFCLQIDIYLPGQ